MSLDTALFLDCQTTGMRPPGAQILELGWASAETPRNFLMALREGDSIPKRVSEITGLKGEDLTQAQSKEDLKIKLLSDWNKGQLAIIHYAQFEKPFLIDLLTELPGPILCTHQLIKRLFPSLPSQNIRACAGFFGPAVVGRNRTATFVRATQQIWQGLLPELKRLGLQSHMQIEEWLKESAPRKSSRYEYRIEKDKRLRLPDQPGVYKMLGQKGEVLYVGKATSLHSRVNSYFRGKKGRDLKKLEMLAQVWDLHVTPTGSPLEAALLESDEIKRLNPPYNVVLKTGRRHLVFYNFDFSQSSREQSQEFSYGPFRNQNWIEHLRLLAKSLGQEHFEQIFFNPIEGDLLKNGYALFALTHNIEELKSVRQLLTYGLNLYRHFEEVEEPPSDDSEVVEEVLSVEDIAAKFERLLRRAGAEYWRARRLTRLLNSRVYLGQRSLEFKGGQLNGASPAKEWPWLGLAIETYDRMSILLSEIDKNGLRSEPIT